MTDAVNMLQILLICLGNSYSLKITRGRTIHLFLYEFAGDALWVTFEFTIYSRIWTTQFRCTQQNKLPISFWYRWSFLICVSQYVIPHQLFVHLFWRLLPEGTRYFSTTYDEYARIKEPEWSLQREVWANVFWQQSEDAVSVQENALMSSWIISELLGIAGNPTQTSVRMLPVRIMLPDY